MPDAFMVPLAHCHSKRGSRRAERAYVKWTEAREGRGLVDDEHSASGLKNVSSLSYTQVRF